MPSDRQTHIANMQPRRRRERTWVKKNNPIPTRIKGTRKGHHHSSSRSSHVNFVQRL